jgi:hypothetical protein
MCCNPRTVARPERPRPLRPGDAPAPPIYPIEELTWTEIDALDRARTLFILPVGMLEQHGPHLPVGADTLAVVYEANAVAQRVSRASSGWSIVMLPVVPYGHSGANQLGDLPIHPGTYALRQSTFRALLADIGRRAYSQFGPTSLDRITRRCRAKRGDRSRSCAPSPPRRVGKAISLRPRTRRRSTCRRGDMVDRGAERPHPASDPRRRHGCATGCDGHAPTPIAPIIERALANEAAFEAELDAWLLQRRR